MFHVFSKWCRSLSISLDSWLSWLPSKVSSTISAHSVGDDEDFFCHGRLCCLFNQLFRPRRSIKAEYISLVLMVWYFWVIVDHSCGLYDENGQNYFGTSVNMEWNWPVIWPVFLHSKVNCVEYFVSVNEQHLLLSQPVKRSRQER